MQAIRRAVIDVGTNSVKLLVAEVMGSEVRPLWEESHQTRLGQGFYDTHRLQPGPIIKTAEAIADFANKARAQGAHSLRVIATSAARDAANAQELLAAIQQHSGLTTEIISGDDEADLAFRGVGTDPALLREALLLLDVGGGSTEFILGQAGQKHFARSFPLGTVRVLEKLSLADPPTALQLKECRQLVREFLETRVKPVLMDSLQRQSLGSNSLQLVGTGGSASILGCMEARLDHFDRERLEATRLSQERLRWHVAHLWSLPLAERKKIVGLPTNRADVILTGTVIYETVLEVFGYPKLRLSTRGLRFGALL